MYINQADSSFFNFPFFIFFYLKSFFFQILFELLFGQFTSFCRLSNKKERNLFIKYLKLIDFSCKKIKLK